MRHLNPNAHKVLRLLRVGPQACTGFIITFCAVVALAVVFDSPRFQNACDIKIFVGG